MEAGARQPTSQQRTIQFVLLAFVAALWVWWGWKDGAYFDSVFYPGELALLALLGLLLAAAPFWGRISGPAMGALIALGGIGLWSALSAVWSPLPAAAVSDAQRALLYAGAFLLGLWVCNLLRGRMVMALAPVAAAGVVVGAATTLTLATGTDTATYLHSDATLRLPIGYRNANATFWLIALWPLLVLACESGLHWVLRALMVGGATMLLELTILSQSRGSLPAAAVALLVLIVVSPRRLRIAVFAGLAALPALPALPVLLDVFQHNRIDGVVPLLRDSARAIAFSSLASVALAALCLRGVEPRLEIGDERVAQLSRIVAGMAVVVVLVGGAWFVGRHGGPTGFLDQRVSEFSSSEDPNLRVQGVRFGANVGGSNREDFWRTALEQWSDHPIAGGGAGSWRLAYLRDRESIETPKDPHSTELLILSELGSVGALLLLAFLVCAVLAGLRSRALGPAAQPLVAGGFAAAAQWLVHASYDWFWLYPAITAPPIFLLGASAAPAVFDPRAGRGLRSRIACATALAVVAVLAASLFVSGRYTDRALGEWQTEVGGAYGDLDRAASTNPWDGQPLLVKGVIAGRVGDRPTALAAFRDAIDREPENFAGHYFLAKELLRSDPRAAARELAIAHDENPLDAGIRRLQRKLPAGEAGEN